MNNQIIKEPDKRQLDLLREGLINKVLNYGLNNAVFSLRDGNINYTLLYCKEGLKLLGRYYNYSKCFYIVKYENMRKELKEVLK